MKKIVKDETIISENINVSRRSFMKLTTASGLGVAAGFLGGALGVAKAASSHEEVTSDIKPGEYDEYYGFWSGGQSGGVRLLGIPSMREFKRIPVFSLTSDYGWGITNFSKNLLKDPKTGQLRTLGDSHHVHLSYQNGTYDGKYGFVNDKAFARLARLRLDVMEIDAMVDIPHAQGTHGIFPSRDKLDGVYCNAEFQNPLPNDGRDLDDPKKYFATHTCIDAETMKVRWQVIVNGNLDLCATDYKGKYSMGTCYNSEDGVILEEMIAADRDWLAIFNLKRIEEAVSAGHTIKIGDSPVPVIDGRIKNNPYVLYIPIPKNPHGVNVDPTGTYAICAGKLSPTVSIISLDKVDDFFAGKLTNPRDCVLAEPEVGLGPLHTAFDGRGNAYTSIFIDSVTTKWNIAKALKGENPVIQKLDVMYQPGHINGSMSETKEADGKWLVSLNKFSKDRFLPVGPMFPDNDQMIDISRDIPNNMRLILDGAAIPEPHDALIVARRIINPLKIWDINDRKFEWERNLLKKLSKRHNTPLELGKSNVILREGKKVYAIMTSQAPKYGLLEIKVKHGDELTIVQTNIDTVENLTHGFCICGYDISYGVAPQETASVTFTANKKGVYWYYCTWFCHALHLEMRGRLIVA
ncbi:MAG: TAT-dependent nitrous-oxide reductase [Legionellales bacterium]|nr:TAT-dependent nitrous-oxide reductase [Legionellales bacterium]